MHPRLIAELLCQAVDTPEISRIVDDKDAEKALGIVRSSKYGGNAALIGRLTGEKGVSMNTPIGGRRMIAPLAGEGLSRIC